ncbi:ABC transporter ATP-binding protein [Gracilibacillus sp. S3-1-1]|uniref:ABC transporter ATP-binding protein n=1 Tax=Gracilibacillus pellucidus TaxID=3095368 RepID=A0ACC6M0I2_9BACI|nr:ABC transporter ATP-binding protein [Gracilibacillus sp. S3-1-1]MDX8044445.1 ABC transporter ATP-binding protein [Gracilibacillus sp. S3-1-1]
MLKILKYFQKKEWLLVACGLLFIVIQVWFDLKIPDFMHDITTLVQTDGSEISEVLKQGSFMVLSAIGSMISAMLVAFFAARLAAGFSKRLRGKVFDKTLSFNMEEISGFSTASLITRSTNDIIQIQMLLILGLEIVLKAPILAIWAVFKIMGKSWEWTFTTGVAVVILLVLIAIVISITLPKFRIIQRLTDNLNLVTRENLSGIRVVRAYNATGHHEQKFEKANDDLTRTNLFTSRTMAILMPAISLIMSGMTLAIYWIGAFLINDSVQEARLPLFSDMVVFSSYAMQVIMAFMMISVVFIMLPRALVSARRVNEVLDTEVKITDGNGQESNVTGKVEFRHVSFKYPGADEYFLKDINFTATKGETVAIIGATGSGKSTLFNLIPRFMEATEGEVLIDGINVRNYNLATLRDKLGYVSQKPVMFKGTVASNVQFGAQEEALDKEVERAVSIAQGTEFVEKMEETYQSDVAQSGTNLSGGQKQRLSIARAIYKNPEIYLFDDSFSALDYRTDRMLRSELKKQIKDATTLIVAQRIGTIIDADRIIVLDKGEVVGIGTHAELMNDCEVYQEIAYSQLSKEELSNG